MRRNRVALAQNVLYLLCIIFICFRLMFAIKDIFATVAISFVGFIPFAWLIAGCKFIFSKSYQFVGYWIALISAAVVSTIAWVFFFWLLWDAYYTYGNIQSWAIIAAAVNSGFPIYTVINDGEMICLVMLFFYIGGYIMGEYRRSKVEQPKDKE